MFKRLVAAVIIFTLVFEQSGFAQVAPQMNIPAYISGYIAPDHFRPVQLRSLSYDAARGDFDLFLDKGDVKKLDRLQITDTAAVFMKYFKTGLTMPNNAFWVNLRPDAPANMIDPDVEKTDLGRVMLAADLQLKKDLARFTDPGSKEGKAYWDKLYAKAEQLFGSEDISIPTVTRPWIVPGEILMRQSQGNAYIYKATLNVMLEQDYLKDVAVSFDDPRVEALNTYSSELIRSIIIPKLVREVNSSRKYAELRQVYYCLILAQWFKGNVIAGSADALLRGANIPPSLRGAEGDEAITPISSQIDTRDLTGLTSSSAWSKDGYFKAYQRSFSQGEYKKEETVPGINGLTVRTYVSGGVKFDASLLIAQPGANGMVVAAQQALPVPLIKNLIQVNPRTGLLSLPKAASFTGPVTAGRNDGGTSIQALSEEYFSTDEWRTSQKNEAMEWDKLRKRARVGLVGGIAAAIIIPACMLCIGMPLRVLLMGGFIAGVVGLFISFVSGTLLLGLRAPEPLPRQLVDWIIDQLKDPFIPHEITRDNIKSFVTREPGLIKETSVDIGIVSEYYPVITVEPGTGPQRSISAGDINAVIGTIDNYFAAAQATIDEGWYRDHFGADVQKMMEQYLHANRESFNDPYSYSGQYSIKLSNLPIDDEYAIETAEGDVEPVLREVFNRERSVAIFWRDQAQDGGQAMPVEKQTVEEKRAQLDPEIADSIDYWTTFGAGGISGVATMVSMSMILAYFVGQNIIDPAFLGIDKASMFMVLFWTVALPFSGLIGYSAAHYARHVLVDEALRIKSFNAKDGGKESLSSRLSEAYLTAYDNDIVRMSVFMAVLGGSGVATGLTGSPIPLVAGIATLGVLYFTHMRLVNKKVKEQNAVQSANDESRKDGGKRSVAVEDAGKKDAGDVHMDSLVADLNTRLRQVQSYRDGLERWWSRFADENKTDYIEAQYSQNLAHIKTDAVRSFVALGKDAVPGLRRFIGLQKPPYKKQRSWATVMFIQECAREALVQLEGSTANKDGGDHMYEYHDMNAVTPVQDPGTVGGIDFRAMPVVMQPALAQAQVQGPDIDRMLEILKMEEERAISTSAELRELVRSLG